MHIYERILSFVIYIENKGSVIYTHKKMRDIRNSVQGFQNYICQLRQSWLGWSLDKSVFHSREEKLMFYF